MNKPVAVVTGGSRGIGRACSIALAQDGFNVIVNYASNASAAQETCAHIAAAGGQATPLCFDVSNPDQVTEAFAKIASDFGPTQALVNNAGITIDGLLMRVKPQDLERTFDIDLKGAIYCAKEASRQMMKNRSGSIINISSVIGEMGNAGQSVYAAAKAGLLGFTKSLAKELGSRQIRVNAITPGFIDTEMTAALSDSQKSAILSSIPLGTLGTPQDVASLVSFLASERSRYLTGQIIGLNGGMYM